MLKISKIETIKSNDGKLVGACPACRMAGKDRKGNHLFIYRGDDGSYENGKFGCVAHPGCSKHRSEIFSLIGVKGQPNDLSDRENRARKAKYAELARKAATQKAEAARITNYIESTLQERLEPYFVENWREELLASSPIKFEDAPSAGHALIHALYKPEEVLWLGDVLDSGSKKHRANFRCCNDWLRQSQLPPRIAPSTFMLGVEARSKANIVSSPYIVIESDELIGRAPVTAKDKERNKAWSCALTRYAEDKLGLTLRAVIDTGNKSLHSWFEIPSKSELEAIRAMADGLRIDSSALNQGHAPFRMPNCIHQKTNKAAQLLYLSN